MTHIIKGLIIIVFAIGSLYALSRLVGKIFDPKNEAGKGFMFEITLCGLMGLSIILIIAYVIGGGA